MIAMQGAAERRRRERRRADRRNLGPLEQKTARATYEHRGSLLLVDAFFLGLMVGVIVATMIFLALH